MIAVMLGCVGMMHRHFSLPLHQGSCSFWFFKKKIYYVSLFSGVDQEKQTIYISCWDLRNYHRHDENINKLRKTTQIFKNYTKS